MDGGKACSWVGEWLLSASSLTPLYLTNLRQAKPVLMRSC